MTERELLLLERTHNMVVAVSRLLLEELGNRAHLSAGTRVEAAELVRLVRESQPWFEPNLEGV